MKYLISYVYWEDAAGSYGYGRAFLTAAGALTEANIWSFEETTRQTNQWVKVCVIGVQELAG